MKDWYTILEQDLLDSPALIFYRDRIQENIDLLIKMVGGNLDRLRPHIKTHKCSKIIELCLNSGIRKFKCSTISEAEILGITGAPDILLAYQPWGPKLIRYFHLVKKFPKTQFSCLFDNFPEANILSKAAEENGIIISVFLDLNIGMNRTGIPPDKEALELLLELRNLSGIKLVGIHAYDGHIHDSDWETRKEKVNRVYTTLNNFKGKIITEYQNLKWVLGGSPTFPIHALEPEVECSPGTFILWDDGYQKSLPEQKFKPAALVLSRVISIVDETQICLDLGHKSIASENPINHRVRFLNSPDLKFLRQSEEHLVVEAEKNHDLFPGKVLYGLPYHICPTVSLYEKAHIIEDHFYKEDWKIDARDRKINV